ncbi:hypothetical protein AV530_005184 [Patagioenas fasciata monilis]|uniref:Uncharacterized protein n=1 Tax=Patagioenas fasciata monilis TaxID=372326 RepID=A0A1V4K628_PATFA|nr:hypothetical protein AV530_005184 [Patagioenas fasciata monilis]
MVTCDPGSDAGTGHPPPYVWNERSEQPRVALPWPSGVISRRRTAAGITEPRKLQTIQDPSVFRPALRPRVFLQGKGSPADSDKSWMVVGGKMSHPQEHPCLVTMPASGSNTSVVTKYHSPSSTGFMAARIRVQNGFGSPSSATILGPETRSGPCQVSGAGTVT